MNAAGLAVLPDACLADIFRCHNCYFESQDNNDPTTFDEFASFVATPTGAMDEAARNSRVING
jgi:hypothetical protein